jgi:hypothetical protein
VEGVPVALELLDDGIAATLALLLPGFMLGSTPGIVLAAPGLDGLLGGAPPFLPGLALRLDLVEPLRQRVWVVRHGTAAVGVRPLELCADGVVLGIRQAGARREGNKAQGRDQEA